MKALDLLASLVLEDGRRWGEAAHPHQWADASAILDPAAPMHFLTRPRGASKTTDLAGIGLATLVEDAPPTSRSYGVAVDADQGRLLVDAITGFVRRTPGLSDRIEVQRNRAMARRSGASLDVLPADAGSAYGLRPWFVIADELAQWPTTTGARGMWEAVVSAMPKVPGSRLVVLTTAGDPAHWSAGVLELARASERWRVSEMAGPCPWVDPAALDEQRRLLLPSSFERLHLNRWTASEDRLTTLDDLRACVTLSGPLAPLRGERYVVAVDLGVKNDRSVAAVVHAEPYAAEVDGQVTATLGQRVVLDRMEVWSGTPARPVSLDAVEEWIAQAVASFGRAQVIIDPWQAVGMAQRLRARGCRVVEFAFSSQSVGRLAQTLYQLIRAHALALPDDEALLDELANVRLRETAPGVVRMDHDPGHHDDRAVALALGATHLLNRPARRQRIPARTVDGFTGRTVGALAGELDGSW